MRKFKFDLYPKWCCWNDFYESEGVNKVMAAWVKKTGGIPKANGSGMGVPNHYLRMNEGTQKVLEKIFFCNLAARHKHYTDRALTNMVSMDSLQNSPAFDSKIKDLELVFNPDIDNRGEPPKTSTIKGGNNGTNSMG
jgi:hypothetical protein